MILDRNEILDHFRWYVDDCEHNNEIPLSWKEWKRECLPELIKILEIGEKECK